MEDIDWFSIILIIGVIIAFCICILGLYFKITEPKEGIVYDKKYSESYTSIIPAGKVLVPVFYPEEWIIYYKKDGDTGSMEVTKEEYEKIQIGDYVKNN